jgi:hypothetical protein
MAATDPDGWNSWFDGEQWASPSVAHLRLSMRHVMERPEEAAARGAAARATLLEKFTPEALAARVGAEVARIQAKLMADPRVAQRRGLGGAAPWWSAAARGMADGAAGQSAAAAAGGGEAAAKHAEAAAPKHEALPTAAPGTSVFRTQREHGGGDGGDLTGRARRAWQSGFTYAEGGPQRSLDPTTMTLAEMLNALERPLPPGGRTSITQWPLQGVRGAGGTPAAGGSIVGEGHVGGTHSQHEHDGWEQREQEEEDDSIVLHS